MLQLNHRVLQLGEEASSQQTHIENNGITIQLLTQRLEEAGRREELQVSSGRVRGVERSGHIKRGSLTHIRSSPNVPRGRHCPAGESKALNRQALGNMWTSAAFASPQVAERNYILMVKE